MTFEPMEAPLRIALFGAGNVGTAVASLLAKAGHEVVGVWSRSEASAERAAALLAAPRCDPARAPDCDVALIGVSDRAIDDVARSLSISPHAMAVHFAGSLGVEAMAALDCAKAALHPVQACPTLDAAIERLPGSAWGITTSIGDEERARTLVERDLGGRAVVVAEGHRVAWHAAAVTTSNGIGALLASGEAILTSIGIDDPIGVLGPIAAGTVANARAGGGGAKTLTGPVVREEWDAIARHAQALAGDPGLSELYRNTIRSIALAASRAGRIDGAAVNEAIVAAGGERR